MVDAKTAQIKILQADLKSSKSRMAKENQRLRRENEELRAMDSAGKRSSKILKKRKSEELLQIE